MRLKDKVALITGAGGGIGRESALLFAGEGASVVAVDVNDEAGNETVELVKSREGRAVYVHADVSKAADCERMVAVAEKEQRDPAIPMIVLSTAHAAKFPEAVQAACGVKPALPEWLGDLGNRAENVTHLPADQNQIERCVLAASRAAREGAAA